MKSPFLSVIVPVYNAGNYLSGCIDSILCQKNCDFEVLLIDDGSTDGSGAICDCYAEKDRRIRVFHQQNSGVSSARNAGMRNACGEWVTFVDSDDRLCDGILSCYGGKNLVPDTLYMFQAVRCRRTSCPDPWPAEFKKTGLTLSKASDSDYETVIAVLIYGTPWGKLYNLELIRDKGLQFDERLSLHEDHCFFFGYLLNIKNVEIEDAVGYSYRVDDSGHSLSGSMPPAGKLLMAYDIMNEELYRICEMNGWDSRRLDYVNSFVFYIKLKALKAAFYSRESSSLRFRVLRDMRRDEVRALYRPGSRKAEMLKKILLCRSGLIKYAALSLFRNKLK